MKPMTVGEVINRLSALDPNLPLYIMSPEGLMLSCNICISETFINWHGGMAILSRIASLSASTPKQQPAAKQKNTELK